MKEKRSLGDLLYFAALVIVFVLIIFGAGLYSASKKNAAYRVVKGVQDTFERFFSEYDALSIVADRPSESLQDARNDVAGVVTNTAQDDNLIFMSGFFDNENELRLIERDGTIVRRWPVPFYDYISDVSYLRIAPTTNRYVDMHGALIEPDGSIVFNYEYNAGAKIDRCGDLVWDIKHRVHHSIEHSESGGYWIPGRNTITDKTDNRFAPFAIEGNVSGVNEDLILKVSDDGEIILSKSVPELLFDNGFETKLTATGDHFRRPGSAGGDSEIVHLNKIAELPSSLANAFPMFEAGDLALSMPTYNLIVVVDPDDWIVKWSSFGPWRRQHDPEFGTDGRIYIFNNNVYFGGDNIGEPNQLDGKSLTNIIAVDPVTNETQIIYGDNPGESFLSVIRGKVELLANGNMLVTEFAAGRVFEVNAQRERVWDYVNRYDEKSVAEITEARVYPRSYFTVDDWSCESD
ncbi:MAG: arylsulfotransferase family protein [Pseudomonadota bacterium]